MMLSLNNCPLEEKKAEDVINVITGKEIFIIISFQIKMKNPKGIF